jgi:hypothetical protein
LSNKVDLHLNQVFYRCGKRLARKRQIMSVECTIETVEIDIGLILREDLRSNHVL